MAGSEDRLQQYFDGELTSEAAEAVRQELEESSEVRAKLEGLSHLRTMLVAAAEEHGDEVDSEALFAGIAAKLAESAEGELADDPMLPAAPATPRPALGVIPGGKKAEPAPKPAKKRVSNVIWIGSALAVAAAVLLFVMQPDGADPNVPDVPIAAAPPPGSEVVDVDFGYSTGAVFSVEGQQGQQYAVVWISDEAPGGAPERVQ